MMKVSQLLNYPLRFWISLVKNSRVSWVVLLNYPFRSWTGNFAIFWGGREIEGSFKLFETYLDVFATYFYVSKLIIENRGDVSLGFCNAQTVK